MGYIYAFDAGDFVKVGKTSNPEKRKAALLSKYKLKEFINEWVSDEISSFDEAECLAHKALYKSSLAPNMGVECFEVGFIDAVKACMGAITLSESFIDGGCINGYEVLVDPSSGYINATKYVKSADFNICLAQFLKNESVKYMNQEIVERTGQPAYFSTRGIRGATFIHPFIFIEVNRSMSVRQKVCVYKWMMTDMLDIKPIIDAIKLKAANK
ncbi:MAG: hypothetical protein COB36_12000 [Alphaproteobacteria bacterium]|nr:MAG: hypothetical protein COB36_12000 [Alphaproteobacteria bacterium]